MRVEDVAHLMRALPKISVLDWCYQDDAMHDMLNAAFKVNKESESFVDALRALHGKEVNEMLNKFEFWFAEVDKFLLLLLCVMESGTYRHNSVQRRFFEQMSNRICAYCLILARVIQENGKKYEIYKKNIRSVYDTLWCACKPFSDSLDSN